MRRIVTVVVTVIVLTLVAGCSGDSSGTGSAPRTSPTLAVGTTGDAQETTSSPAPSASDPTPAAVIGFQGGPFHLEDDRQYTFDVMVQLNLDSPAVNTQIDPPGTAAVFATVSGTMSLTNTTSGHDYPNGAIGYAVVQLWPESSPVCVAYHHDEGQVNASTPVVSLLSPEGDYCSIPVGATETPQTIPTTVTGESDSQPVVAPPAIAPSSGSVMGGYPVDDVILDSIPEASAPAVAAQLATNPPIYVVAYERSGNHPPHTTDGSISAACAQLYQYSFGPVVGSSVPITCPAS